jgi:L-ascorbate metabolism protein UlaG (beta-lactamase superfamily)
MSALRIVWLGHSTALLELDGVRLLTDPLLRSRIAHVRRVAGPADPHTLRDIDAVLISHLHYDHLDVSSLRRLEPRPRILLPKGAGGFLRRRGFTVTDVSVGDEVRVGALTIHVTPATHEGRRHPFGRNAPAVGYLIVGSARVYFAGDTDLFDEMSAIAPVDVALLPIWGWGPTIGEGHLDPVRAAEAVRVLDARLVVPIHWGTYSPSIVSRRPPPWLLEPVERFRTELDRIGLLDHVRILTPGERLTLPEAA